MTRRPLEELIDTLDPAWRLVQEWIAGARNHVEVLPVDQARGADTLLRLQVTSRAVLGAVALETGGILVDHGWLRFLGSGHARVRGTLLTWNGMGERADEHPLSGALVVAYDVVGGFFALNGGAFPGKQGDASYLAPDTLRWEGLAMSYSQLLHWALTGDLAKFYEALRWPGWQADVAALADDRGFSFYPPLWAREGGAVGERSRRPVPVAELWRLHRDWADQLRDLPDGSEVQLVLEDGPNRLVE